ncbi:MAG: NusG domain II-containing protein [Actinobacteria bacterium]|nr:NusG domain II-containing protein [Actinomycetota bacterium]MBU1943634.1 NusG domain II-containing protein [Actinomycetota bacterium]
MGNQGKGHLTVGGQTGKVRLGDLVLVALVVVAAAASVMLVSAARAGEKGSLVIIEVNGREVKRVALGPGQAARTFKIETGDGYNMVVVDGGRVRVKEADCRDRVCLGMGWAETSGDNIICLPHRMVIRVVGRRAPNGVDTVVE